MLIDQITHEIRLAQWSKLIQECRSSGLSIRNWCQEHDISEKKFYYWQRRVRNQAYQISQQQDPSSVAFAVLPASPSHQETYQGFETTAILHSGNMTIELANSTSESLLYALRKVLTYAE